MCRLLVVRNPNRFDPSPHLEKFAHIARHSKEYQGHGWGCAYQNFAGKWELYKNIQPIWEDDLSQFPSATLLVAHARSAFEDTDIVVENNMPFFDGRSIFIFNGELRGVRIRESGRIGAEKIFNYIRRFDKGNTGEAIFKATSIIKKRTQHIRGLNLVMINDEGIHLFSFFKVEKSYFTMHVKEKKELVICSQPYDLEDGWKPISNDSIKVW